jgi:hypothetical protein
MDNRTRAVQERRRSGAAGPHQPTRQTRAAMLVRALHDDPITWARMRQHITAVEEADREDEES